MVKVLRCRPPEAMDRTGDACWLRYQQLTLQKRPATAEIRRGRGLRRQL